MNMKRSLWLGLIVLAAAAGRLPGQGKDAAALLREIFPIPAMTGNEELLVDKIKQILPSAGPAAPPFWPPP
ncbi:MAG: hypothetical protein FJY82_12380 [Candidatus Aminicenantes bacterium]|nr:hypothetical protein [Candidatus Aminicenantes bacterium]